MPQDVKHLSLEELKALERSMTGELKAREQARRAEALAAIEKICCDYGFKNIAEVVGGRGIGRRRFTTMVPAYRNPENPEETWSGRGRRPLWLNAMLKKGVPLEKMRICTKNTETET